MKIRPAGFELFHTDGQTDVSMQFCEHSYKGSEMGWT